MGIFDALFKTKKDLENGTGQPAADIQVKLDLVLEDIANNAGLTDAEKKELFGDALPADKKAVKGVRQKAR